MIVTVNSQQLAQALRAVCKVVPSKPPIQILSYVLIEAIDVANVLRFTATDLEISLSYVCPGTVSAPGKVALPALTFLQMIEQFSEGQVTLMADETGARVQCGGFSSRLQTQPAKEFPALTPHEGQSVVLPGVDFNRLITATRYAVADRGKKYILEATLLRLAGTSMGMVATDTARLSIATATREEGLDFSVMIPRKTLDVLPCLGTEKINLLVGTNHLFFSAANMSLTSRMIDGKFPAYERIIPRGNDQVMTIDRAKLASALRRVGVASEKNGAIYCTAGPDSLRISTRSVEVGEADEQLSASYSGTPLSVCINWKYLLEFLEVAQRPSITISMKDGKSPLLVSDSPSFINVIMTMKG